MYSPTAIEAEAQCLINSSAALPFCNDFLSAGVEDDDQPLKRQKIDDHDTLPDPPAVDVEEIGSQDTDDEEHSANAEIEDEFLQVLDQVTFCLRISTFVRLVLTHTHTHTHANPDAQKRAAGR